MPITNLVPNSTTTFDSHGNGHAQLTDASDATSVNEQLSQFETIKYARGGCSDLPISGGKVTDVQINMRAFVGSNPGDHLNLLGGVYATNAMGQNLTTSVAAYTGHHPTAMTALQVNAMEWWAGWTFGSNDGVQGWVTELNFDVTWFPTGGIQAMTIGLIGPLLGVGVLLAEMAKFERMLRRTRFLPGEAEACWRAARAYRFPHTV